MWGNTNRGTRGKTTFLRELVQVKFARILIIVTLLPISRHQTFLPWSLKWEKKYIQFIFKENRKKSPKAVMIFISRPTRTRTWELPRRGGSLGSLLTSSPPCSPRPRPWRWPSRATPRPGGSPCGWRRTHRGGGRSRTCDPVECTLMKMLFLIFFKDYLVVSKVLAVACLPVVGGRALYTTRKIDIIF